MIRFIFAIVLVFGVPWFLFWLASVTLVPFFGITNHPTIAAILFCCVPSGFSIFAGCVLGSGARLPDN